MAEDASSKKFTVSQFLNFRMVNDRSVIDQLHKIQHIVSQIHLQGILLDDSFIVPSIIDKLPPTWKDFRKSLKHKKEKMSLEDLAQCLRIEEESRIRDNKEEHEHLSSKIYLVKNVKDSNQQGKGNQKRNKNLEKKFNKNKRRKWACFNYGKPGYYKSATVHVCIDRNLFSTYEIVEDGSVLYMGNSSTAEVKEKGKVELEFTSGKCHNLTNVYHGGDICMKECLS
ncbi:uncharacterized protein LOC143882861 [Tasmannia lanceolata]|uniref:uncharacterized protein LOC143882861 n=1 Tax=Tasmannia lanceolata TaxID=3420 RepID=UPI0040628AB8